jgi:hypothetical protein
VGAEVNVQRLVLAICAMPSCQDAVFYIYKSQTLPTRITYYSRVQLPKNTSSLLDTVSEWREFNFDQDGRACRNMNDLFQIGISEANLLGGKVDRAVFVGIPSGCKSIVEDTCSVRLSYQNRFNVKFHSYFVGRSSSPATNSATIIGLGPIFKLFFFNIFYVLVYQGIR